MNDAFDEYASEDVDECDHDDLDHCVRAHEPNDAPSPSEYDAEFYGHTRQEYLREDEEEEA